MSFVLLSSWYLEDDLFSFLQAGPKLIFKISKTIKVGCFFFPLPLVKFSNALYQHYCTRYTFL